MTTKLYHYKVGFPIWLASFRMPAQMTVTYSRHAMSASVTDARIEKIPTPDILTFGKYRVVEVEVDNNTLIKLVVRVYDYHPTLDFTYVIQADGTVRTVWTNQKGDFHATLDASKYSIPEG